MKQATKKKEVFFRQVEIAEDFNEMVFEETKAVLEEIKQRFLNTQQEYA